MLTEPNIKLHIDAQKMLRCPVCKSSLSWIDNQFNCDNSDCKSSFPVSQGTPILINESNSIFSIEDFVKQGEKKNEASLNSKIKNIVNKLSPKISLNVKGKESYQTYTELLFKENKNPIILIIGGGQVGEGMEALLSHPSIEFIESDVYFGPQTELICDAHDLPFDDKSFDGVIVQAVLEHVVDPHRCVEEIYRVLKDNGLVYAETPFMQQVHMGRYDFTRFTYLGHRRLFRKFEEISGGATCGPGMALAWAYKYFLLSFFKASAAQSFVNLFVKFTSFWLKYFDYYLIDKPGTFDAASGYYFIGRKSDRVLSDRELIKLYKGTQLYY